VTTGPGAGPGAHVDDSVWRFRVRLLAGCVLLVGVAMIQSPGLLVPDTKLDLAIDPLDFLGRAAHLWDAEGAFGQLQNQAYGYLWPMGPFFVLGWLLDLPGWVVQRLWLALVLAVAFTGAAKVSRALGVRSDLACIVAGFAFALSPRMLTTLGPISIEAWPSALAPWVLLPLVIGATRGSPRRAAALSALAIAIVGGVNAAATAAVLPLGALWLLTRTPGPRRRSMMLWWPVFTLLGTLWWLVPLFVMGAYSPPFLDYIESAANTTFPTTLFDALRGTSNWVPYVDSSSRAGNDLIRESYLVLNSGVVLVAGLVGLMLRRNPHRLFLVSGLLVGLFLVTMGHTGAVQGWFAPQIQELLDGPLAPLRNVHKFDPVIRLPMVIGLAWTVDALVSRAAEAREAAERINLRVLAGVVVFAVAAASLPAVTGRVTPAGGFEAIPAHWHEAAAWLAQEQDQGVALLVPGSSFGRYTWGSPRDEPLQVLGDTPWAVRNAVPLTPAGNIRMLDAIEQRLATGHGSAGLTTQLRRSGVSHLVVRNDLQRSSDVVDPVLVHQALDSAPGINRVATFGPDVGGEAHLERAGQRILVNGGWQNTYPAIEVYEVAGGASYAGATHEPAPVVLGGPEDLPDLADLGLVSEDPVVLAGDLGEERPEGRLVLTDGARAVERHFGRLHGNVSETLHRGQDMRLEATVRDYVLEDASRWSTFAEFEGIAGVTASSSVSDPSAGGESEPGGMPFSALDGHAATAWSSGRFARDVHWWRVDLEQPVLGGNVSITAGPDEDQELVVRTRSWSSDRVRVEAGETAQVHVPGRISSLRVEDASDRDATRLSLAEVVIPGVNAERRLVLPRLPSGSPTPDSIVLRAVDDNQTGCATVDAAVRCVPGREVAAEEPLGFKRRLELPAAVRYRPQLMVRALPAAVDDLALGKALFGVQSSSVASPDSRSTALAALDGDPGTTWTADPDDVVPTLTLTWLGRRTVRGIGVDVAQDTAARVPLTLRLEWPGGRRVVRLGDDGAARFRPIRSDELEVSVIEADGTTSLGFDGSGLEVPIGISELRVRGLPFVPAPLLEQPRKFPCGTGPAVVVNGVARQTSVTAAPAQLFAGMEVPARLCGVDSLALVAGQNEVDAVASLYFTPQQLVLGDDLTPDPVTSVDAQLRDPVTRFLTNPDGLGSDPLDEAVVATRENANPGWHAERSGALDPTVVDGWRQGWRTSEAGTTPTLTMTFAPDNAYRLGLGAGFSALLLLVLLVLRGRRRRAEGQLAALTERRAPRLLLMAVALGMAGALAGGGGLVTALAVVAVTAVARRSVPAMVPGVVALAVVLATAAYLARPWADPAGWAGDLAWPHYLVVVAVAALLVLGESGAPRRPRFRSRMAGSSTTR
jgi:arabinofuranan 3-O-arabinosyltransferase